MGIPEGVGTGPVHVVIGTDLLHSFRLGISDLNDIRTKSAAEGEKSDLWKRRLNYRLFLRYIAGIGKSRNLEPSFKYLLKGHKMSLHYLFERPVGRKLYLRIQKEILISYGRSNAITMFPAKLIYTPYILITVFTILALSFTLSSKAFCKSLKS